MVWTTPHTVHTCVDYGFSRGSHHLGGRTPRQALRAPPSKGVRWYGRVPPHRHYECRSGLSAELCCFDTHVNFRVAGGAGRPPPRRHYRCRGGRLRTTQWALGAACQQTYTAPAGTTGAGAAGGTAAQAAAGHVASACRAPGSGPGPSLRLPPTRRPPSCGCAVAGTCRAAAPMASRHHCGRRGAQVGCRGQEGQTRAQPDSYPGITLLQLTHGCD